MKEVTWLLEEKYHGNKTREFFKDFEQLKKGEPVDYLIGFIPFLNCHIDLSLRPFIPRPETEFWVTRAIEQITQKRGRNAHLRILDLFSGSGAIGISLLKHFPRATVTLGEHDKRLIKQIRINIKKNIKNAKRARIICTDGFSRVHGKYDYIFANPPYIAHKRKHVVHKDVLAWEPKIALFARDNGLSHIKDLINNTSNYTREGGAVFIEFDFPQKHAIEHTLKKCAGLEYGFWRDQYKKWRTVAVMPTPHESSILTQGITKKS